MNIFRFDFFKRRQKQDAIERSSSERKHRHNLTVEEIEQSKKHAAFLKQFILDTIIGAFHQQERASGMDSRQVRRRKNRIDAFCEMTKRFPGELRRVRRSMAFDSLKVK
jgi:hypothetical protein